MYLYLFSKFSSFSFSILFPSAIRKLSVHVWLSFFQSIVLNILWSVVIIIALYFSLFSYSCSILCFLFTIGSKMVILWFIFSSSCLIVYVAEFVVLFVFALYASPNMSRFRLFSFRFFCILSANCIGMFLLMFLAAFSRLGVYFSFSHIYASNIGSFGMHVPPTFTLGFSIFVLGCSFAISITSLASAPYSSHIWAISLAVAMFISLTVFSTSFIISAVLKFVCVIFPFENFWYISFVNSYPFGSVDAIILGLFFSSVITFVGNSLSGQ